MTEAATDGVGSWRDLLGPRYLGTSGVLAGGVALYAINEFLTVSLLPSAVGEIGGQRLYSWVTTVYLVASVAAATTVGAVLTRLGPRWAYLLSLTVFGLGSVLCAAAPRMELLLVGRVVQGGGGGLLAGLGYAVINAALPQRLWTRASALVSAMWGVGTLVGPASGGLFAQLGMWRWAFGSLTVLTVVMGLLVPVVLPRRDAATTRTPWNIPTWSLMLLGTAALLVSAAAIPHNPAATVVLLGAGVGVVALFVVVDRRADSSVLPPTAFRPGPLKWIYITLGMLMAATMVDMYVPLFGQRLAGLVPVVAGLLAAALSVGWTAGELTSASVDRPRTTVRIVAVAPLVMAAGLAIAALTQVAGAPPLVVVAWACALALAGTGIGMAWPHLSAWAMGAVEDPGEAATAAAAINTVQLMSGAIGAGMAGVVVNMTDRGDASASRWLFAVFAVLAAFGYGASRRAGRGRV
ncbi:MFS transporter [Mycolicibacterium palauense]|uniref:MFS transporter n=1 Tax=Mycolicibacterium palauense TaxID=2034511 RepID=UPI000BFF09FE|nr:MFS transporter [Mycolicibacterium palauense]